MANVALSIGHCGVTGLSMSDQSVKIPAFT